MKNHDEVAEFNHIGTSEELMLHNFCKIISPAFTILSYYISHPVVRIYILSEDERPVLGYDVMILSDLLHFSTSHDALISSIQLLLAKLEKLV